MNKILFLVATKRLYEVVSVGRLVTSYFFRLTRSDVCRVYGLVLYPIDWLKSIQLAQELGCDSDILSLGLSIDEPLGLLSRRDREKLLIPNRRHLDFFS